MTKREKKLAKRYGLSQEYDGLAECPSLLGPMKWLFVLRRDEMDWQDVWSKNDYFWHWHKYRDFGWKRHRKTQYKK